MTEVAQLIVCRQLCSKLSPRRDKSYGDDRRERDEDDDEDDNRKKGRLREHVHMMSAQGEGKG